MIVGGYDCTGHLIGNLNTSMKTFEELNSLYRSKHKFDDEFVESISDPELRAAAERLSNLSIVLPDYAVPIEKVKKRKQRIMIDMDKKFTPQHKKAIECYGVYHPLPYDIEEPLEYIIGEEEEECWKNMKKKAKKHKRIQEIKNDPEFMEMFQQMREELENKLRAEMEQAKQDDRESS